MGAALGLSEFKVTTPLAQGTGEPLARIVQVASNSSSVSATLSVVSFCASCLPAILIHFHMFHRGSARTIDAAQSPLVATSDSAQPPLRPMVSVHKTSHPDSYGFVLSRSMVVDQVKFQFYSTSEPTQPNWDVGALGDHGHTADWGELDGEHGSFASSPEVTAVWDDILSWMRGESLQRSTTLLAPEAVRELTAQFETDDVEGEPRRMGCAYLTGREAGGGSVEALNALESAIRDGSDEGGRMVSDAPGLGNRARCGIWGCVAAGDAATPMLLRMLEETELSLVIRAGTALGESCQHPTVEIIQAIGATIDRLRGLINLQDEGLSLEYVKAERQLATFASKETKERYRRIEWQAMDVLAQALWYITSRVIRNRRNSLNATASATLPAELQVCEAVVSVVIALMDEDINLPSTTRMNAAYTAVSLAQLDLWPSAQSKEALAAALARASVDDDRYVVAAAAEGLKWLRLREIGNDDHGAAAVAARQIIQKLVWERWCPINSVRAPF
jgi:hypothetical protein